MKRDPLDESLRSLARPVPPPPIGEAERIRRSLMAQPNPSEGLLSLFRRRWLLVPSAVGFAAATLLLLRPGQSIDTPESPQVAMNAPAPAPAPMPAPAPALEAQDDAEIALFVADVYNDFDLDESDADDLLYMADLAGGPDLR